MKRAKDAEKDTGWKLVKGKNITSCKPLCYFLDAFHPNLFREHQFVDVMMTVKYIFLSPVSYNFTPPMTNGLKCIGAMNGLVHERGQITIIP